MRGLYGLIDPLAGNLFVYPAAAQWTPLQLNSCCDCFLSLALWVQMVTTSPGEAEVFLLNAKPVRLSVTPEMGTFCKRELCMKHCDVSIKLSAEVHFGMF